MQSFRHRPGLLRAGAAALLLALAAGGAQANDRQVAEVVSDWTTPITLGVMGLAYGDAFGAQASRPLADDLARALTWSTLTTHLLKVTINEPRPSGHDGYGFPSGHTSMAFAFAHTLAVREPQWTIPAYAFATAVGWSRVRLDAHTTKQVIAGALLGWLVADRTVTRHRPEDLEVGAASRGGVNLAQWSF